MSRSSTYASPSTISEFPRPSDRRWRVSLNAMLMPLYGRPMLSSMTLIWSLPTISSNRFLDFREIALRLLKPAARRRANVQPHLARVHLRKEVHAKVPHGKQSQRASINRRKKRSCTHACSTQQATACSIAFAKRVETAARTRVDRVKGI